MAPTKRAPRKSLSGKAPRKLLAVSRYLQFEDYARCNYTVVSHNRGTSQGVGKLGVQLYCLGNPQPSPEALGNSFLSCPAIINVGHMGNRWPRVDVYSGFYTVEECVEHHRQEKAFRKQAVQEMRPKAAAGLSEDAHEKLISEVRGKEPLPHIVPTWCASAKFWREYHTSNRYRSWIFIMPEGCLSWDGVVEKGLFQVQFDLDVTPAMETETFDCNVYKDTKLQNDKYGWVEVERSGVEQYVPVQRTLLCCREQPRDAFFGLGEEYDVDRMNKVMHAWKTPGYKDTLDHAWDQATLAFWDCAYRRPSCDGCSEDEPHDVYEVELNEHYFDDDGQCIACRRATDYRRRSKRIAARTQK
ncbi:hypothetical protein QQZ08_007447 [Neonectria magnoliae]|uniref:Uncharacterized protein n=1 Tax=Neonectria magnoliae TaxID=2732573 RepID=A0ABR1HYE9_9HYPO